MGGCPLTLVAERNLGEINKTKQALIIHLSLTRRSRAASSEIKTGYFKEEECVKTLLLKLGDLFLAGKGRLQFADFYEL